MKTSLIIALVAFTAMFSACKKTELNKESSFWVRGNCEMCKERIEKTAKAQLGVGTATWDVESGMMKVQYDSNMVTEMDIQKAIAATGHATKTVPMDQKAHDALPECCQVGESMDDEPAAAKDTAATSCCSTAGSCSTHEGKSCCANGVCAKDQKSCKDAKGTCMSKDADCCHAQKSAACCSTNGHCALNKEGKSCCDKSGKCSKDGNSCTSEKGKCQTSAGACCS